MPETIYEMSKRICKSVQDCRDCPIFCIAGPAGLNCLFTRFGKEIEVIDAQLNVLREWAKEHPAKTYKDVFLEKLPNTRLDKNGGPVSCRNIVFGIAKCCTADCKDCWNEPYKEVR